jgi:hypothetical protein
VTVDGKPASFLTGGKNYLYEIRVIESFRGVQKAGDVVKVQTALGGPDCGYRFEIGRKYLVDGWNEGSVLHTNTCTMTAPFDRSEAELRILRKIAAHQPLPNMVGNITHYAGPPDGELLGPLPGIIVKLQPMRGGTALSASTDTIGSFSFSNVPPGNYQVFLSLPPNLSPAFASFGKFDGELLPPIMVEKIGDTVCHADIVLGPSGSISGVVKSSTGQFDGWVNADNVKPDGTPWNTVLSTTPDSNGSFSLEHLKPGRYQIKFIRRQEFVQGEPQIINLEDGERKTGIVLVAK